MICFYIAKSEYYSVWSMNCRFYNFGCECHGLMCVISLLWQCLSDALTALRTWLSVFIKLIQLWTNDGCCGSLFTFLLLSLLTIIWGPHIWCKSCFNRICFPKEKSGMLSYALHPMKPRPDLSAQGCDARDSVITFCDNIRALSWGFKVELVIILFMPVTAL